MKRNIQAAAKLKATYGSPNNLNGAHGGPCDLARDDVSSRVDAVVTSQDENSESEPNMRTITFYTGDE